MKVGPGRGNRSAIHQFRWLTSALFAVFIWALATSGCHQAEQTEQPFEQTSSEWRGEIAPNELNIALITIDTLRSDRVSSYVSERVDPPTIDGFASEGGLFANAASTVRFTLQAHSSIPTIRTLRPNRTNRTIRTGRTKERSHTPTR